MTERLTQLIALRDAVKGATGADACWSWGKCQDVTVKGRIWIDGKIMLAHRAMWEATNGPIPAGKLICHTCDNGGCINPAHMYVGTHADNMRDMRERRRYFAAKEPERVRELGRQLGESNTWTRGEGNPRVKLSTGYVAAIRASTQGPSALARLYRVHRTTIQRIQKGTLWAV